MDLRPVVLPGKTRVAPGCGCPRHPESNLIRTVALTDVGSDSGFDVLNIAIPGFEMHAVSGLKQSVN